MTFDRIATIGFMVAPLLAGCASPKMNLAEMMNAPPRPAELDRLNDFIGTWEFTAEMRLSGSDEAIPFSGTYQVTWDADGWAIVERFEGRMGDYGTMKGVGVWSWDTASKRFKTVWIDSYGMHQNGTTRYDEKSGRWAYSSRGRAPDGHEIISEGAMQFVDPNTISWTHTDYDGMKLVKFAELTGTNRRR